MTPCTEALLPSEAGKEAALLRVQIKAGEATLGARVSSELPTRCWCLLLGQERVAVGFHLFQSLHEVAVAHLKLLCFVQCRSKLEGGGKAMSLGDFASLQPDGVLSGQEPSPTGERC